MIRKLQGALDSWIAKLQRRDAEVDRAYLQRHIGELEHQKAALATEVEQLEQKMAMR